MRERGRERGVAFPPLGFNSWFLVTEHQLGLEPEQLSAGPLGDASCYRLSYSGKEQHFYSRFLKHVKLFKLMPFGGNKPCNKNNSSRNGPTPHGNDWYRGRCYTHKWWFGYIARLSQWGRGESLTCSNDFYLPSRRRGGGGQHPMPPLPYPSAEKAEWLLPFPLSWSSCLT